MKATAVCTKCRQEKPVEAFAFKPYGSKLRRTACKDCGRAAAIESAKRRGLYKSGRDAALRKIRNDMASFTLEQLEELDVALRRYLGLSP